METRGRIIAGAAIAGFLVALAAGWRALRPDVEPAGHPSFLYGRITSVDGDTYEGRLRFGGDEEAAWGDYFNGAKGENPWSAHVPAERLPKERLGVEVLGFEIGWERPVDLGRPFMARFGDIARIEADGRDLRVTLKSGTLFRLDRYGADDFADGLRVWDAERGVVELEERRVRTIELLPPPPSRDAAPSRLHGTVRTAQGDFTGFLQWDREEGVASDELDGHAADGELLALPFRIIRSITRRSSESARVALLDGREVVLSGTREVGKGSRGIYVDDPRYGRVLVSWDAFERADLGAVGSGPAGSGPAYGDFPPGRPLTGSVTTRDGRRLAGRLVYDLDESEVTETLDAPSGGVDYTLPFGLVASIVLPGHDDRARVTLHGGEELRLERTGDLGDGNAGILVFVDRRERPEYVPWSDVERVDLDRPPAMYPPVDGRWIDASRQPAPPPA